MQVKTASGVRQSLGTLVLAALVGCSSLYYSAWEQLGKQKRDLLRDYVVAARDDQIEANKEFKDALQVLREAYRVEPSKLQKTYDRLKESYDDAEGKSKDLEQRIEKMHRIANDLFAEWKKEANIIRNRSLRQDSLAQLEQTKERYAAMRGTLQRAEARMKPILEQFRDHVLYLKHNLNAQALGALQGEAANIEQSIEELIESMRGSIAETNEFIETLSR